MAGLRGVGDSVPRELPGLEAPFSPAWLPARLLVGLWPGDASAEAAGKDPLPGLKQQRYPPTSFLVV